MPEGNMSEESEQEQEQAKKWPNKQQNTPPNQP